MSGLLSFLSHFDTACGVTFNIFARLFWVIFLDCLNSLIFFPKSNINITPFRLIFQWTDRWIEGMGTKLLVELYLRACLNAFIIYLKKLSFRISVKLFWVIIFDCLNSLIFASLYHQDNSLEIIFSMNGVRNRGNQNYTISWILFYHTSVFGKI